MEWELKWQSPSSQKNLLLGSDSVIQLMVFEVFFLHIDGVKTCKYWVISRFLEFEASAWSDTADVESTEQLLVAKECHTCSHILTANMRNMPILADLICNSSFIHLALVTEQSMYNLLLLKVILRWSGKFVCLFPSNHWDYFNVFSFEAL